ncbi:hypothetical protein D3C87_1640090 [compost metagenome]
MQQRHALAAARVALVADIPALVQPALDSCRKWSGNTALEICDVLYKVARLNMELGENHQPVRDGLNDLLGIYRRPYPDKEKSDVRGARPWSASS